jgi:hypothetical protein
MFGGKRLERRLEAERPAPERDFLRRMKARIEEDSPRTWARPSLRLGFALVVAAGSLVVAGLAGGLGYAADAVTHASDSVGHTFKGVADPGPKHVSTSESIAPSSVSAATFQYTGPGYYCFNKKKNFKLKYISTQHDFEAQSNGGFTAVAYYSTTKGPCPPTA